MVKNVRMEFRVTQDMKEDFEWKAKQLGITQTELFERLCVLDIGFKESDLYGGALKRKKDLVNNETDSLCDNFSSEIFKDEEEEWKK